MIQGVRRLPRYCPEAQDDLQRGSQQGHCPGAVEDAQELHLARAGSHRSDKRGSES